MIIQSSGGNKNPGEMSHLSLSPGNSSINLCIQASLHMLQGRGEGGDTLISTVLRAALIRVPEASCAPASLHLKMVAGVLCLQLVKQILVKVTPLPC